MAFLAFSVQYQTIKTQMNQKNYELDTIKRVHESITEHLKDLKETKSEKDLKNNDAYQDLVAYDMAYDIKQDTLQMELDVLKAQAESFKKARNEGVKSSVKWNCFG